VDFLPDLKPIGVPESRYEGRLTGKGTLGRRAKVRMDGHSFTQAHYTVLQFHHGGSVYQETQEYSTLQKPGEG
jgi:hypothetical protein